MLRTDALLLAACAVALVAACDRTERKQPDRGVSAEAPAPAGPARPPAPRVASEPAEPLPDTLPGEPEADAFPLPRLIARGNEPFWAVDVDGTVLVWKTPEDPEGKVLPATRSSDAGGVKFSGDDEGQAFELDIRGTPCVDSMSGARFEFTAVWTHAGARHSGCAQRVP